MIEKNIENQLFFDWYSAAVDVGFKLFADAFKRDHEWLHIEPARPRNGYERAYAFVGGDGVARLTTMFGGASQGSKLNCTATGEHSPAFASWLRSRFPVHEVVRTDVAIDFDEPAAWLSLHGLGSAAAKAHKLKTQYIGPSGMETSPDPDSPDGRTLRVGSRKSVSYARIYEKGKKDNQDFPNWVRLEFEFKPQTYGARVRYASASPAEIMASTKLGRYLLFQLGHTVPVRPCAPGAVWVKPDYEKSLDYLSDKFAKTLLELDSRCNGDAVEFREILLRQRAAIIA